MTSGALVTGASGGLGERFAHRLAQAGRPVVLVARRADRLETLAAELTDRHGVRALALPADLADPGAPAAIEAALASRGWDVDLLVNDAGFGLAGAFDELDGARQLAILDVNARAVVDLTHRLLGPMRRRGRGAILNVASTAAFQPGPWFAVYYASKAFVLSWSEALHEELAPHGIHVTALCPGPVDTGFARVAGSGFGPLQRRFAVAPDAVVDAGLAGLARNDAVVVPGRLNALVAATLRLLPRGAVRRLAARVQRAR